MSIILSVLTNVSCGEACWHAKEETCRCSCGGKNHGILLQGGKEQPIRQSKISGKRYELKAVGLFSEIYNQCKELLSTFPPYRIDPIMQDGVEIMRYTYTWKPEDCGPYVCRPASKAQCVLWKELSEYKGLSEYEFYKNKPYMLWQEIKTT